MSPDGNGIRQSAARAGFVCHMAGVLSFKFDDAVSHVRFTNDLLYITRVQECADNERYTVYLQGFRSFLCNAIEKKYEFHCFRNERITLVFLTIKNPNVRTNVKFFFNNENDFCKTIQSTVAPNRNHHSMPHLFPRFPSTRVSVAEQTVNWNGRYW